MEKIEENIQFAINRAAFSLSNMIREMMKKHLELKRITKTASLLRITGFELPGVYNEISERCLEEQHSDGGWVAVVDTMWNAFFLSFEKKYEREKNKAFLYLKDNQSDEYLWGRSKRDFSRIPVSGIMLSLFPELAKKDRLQALEKLWVSEIFSLTYKAAYTLMAFKINSYNPLKENLIQSTLNWLQSNQRDDGSFAPWKDHPVCSDTYCTSIALLGLLSYGELVQEEKIIKTIKWLLNTQLKNGIWPFHEIEDGASWAIYALYNSNKFIKK